MSGRSKRSIRVPEEVQERSRRGPEEVQEKSTRGPGEDQWRSRGGPGEVQEKSWRSRRFKGSRYLDLDDPRDSRGPHLIFINGFIFKDQHY